MDTGFDFDKVYDPTLLVLDPIPNADGKRAFLPARRR